MTLGLPVPGATAADSRVDDADLAKAPVRPVDHALATEDGLWHVLEQLEAYAQGK